METESRTTTTSAAKVSDSVYSNSCSNTDYQGSAGSKSRRSGSNSSGSSGYGGAAQNGDGNTHTDDHLLKPINKDKENKKQKLKPEILSDNNNADETAEITHHQSASIIKAETNVNLAEIKTTIVDVEPSAPIQTANIEQLINSLRSPNIQLKETIANETADVLEEPKQILWIDNLSIQETNRLEYDGIEKNIPLLDYDTVALNQTDENFCCIISMYDGVVLYTTPSLTNILGFPKDMWLGRSFIDFIHPKDRETFSTQVTTSISLPITEGKERDITYLYVCLRRYREVKQNIYGFVEKHVSYKAFRLTVSMRHIANSYISSPSSIDHNNGLFLVVVAVPLNSSYKVPVERKNCAKFGMRHSATCIFNHVDPEVVTSFGFLPQDMLGKSVFDFYHPEDMPFLKEVYKSVINMCQINGSVFRSKPYRFLVQNGCFAMVETEWSSIVNPWSRRLEFVISLHKVLEGPLNPNVFDTPSDGEYNKIPEKAIKEGKVLQTEIINILSQELPNEHTNVIRQDATKHCKDLANLVNSLINDVKSQKSDNEMQLDVDPTFSERDSAILGEISPHHDYYDSKSSSETPPSYNQLNYNENISRFFQSNPKTTASDESNAMETDAKNIHQECTPNNQKCLSPVANNSRESRSGSAGNLSSEIYNIESGNTSRTNMSNDSYKPLHLTASILDRHNEDMEMNMIKKHKKGRFINKDRETKKSNQKIEKFSNDLHRNQINNNGHGVKRNGSPSWEADCHHLTKQRVVIDRNKFAKNEPFYNNPATTISNATIQAQTSVPAMNNEPRMANTFHNQNGMNMWGSFQIPSTSTTQICNVMPNPTTAPAGMVPFCYMPVVIPPARPNYTEPSRYQVQFMPPGVFYNYNSIYQAPPPILYSTIPMIPMPMQTQTVANRHTAEIHHFSNSFMPPKPNGDSTIAVDHPDFTGQLSLLNPDQQSLGNVIAGIQSLTPHCQRPSSQATSIKAEPGSRIGSIASASVANKAMSECSRKDLGLQSVCSPDTPLVSPPDGELTQTEFYNLNSKANENIKTPNNQYETVYRNNKADEDSSCFSSLHSSFFKTDTGSGSNDDSGSNNRTKGINEDLANKKTTYPTRIKDAPTTQSVSMSSDLFYRYQVTSNDLENISKADRDAAKNIDQPIMVNEQLQQLYADLELEGLSKGLTLEEGIISSSSEENPFSSRQQQQKKKRTHDNLAMFYEEDAPLPSPENTLK